MLTSIKSRLISFFLVVALVFSLMCASAIPANAASDISSPGGNGESKVVTTVDPSIFSVTVPYVLPITVDANQNVSTADNAQIINNSNGPIKVANAVLETNDGWELVENGTDFKTVPVNSKKFTMEMQASPIATTGIIDKAIFSSINGNGALDIDYTADVAVQGEALNGVNIANVVFTVEWDSYELSGDVVSKTALNTFAVSNNLKTFQRTTENLNIDDVLADDRMVKIDNAPVVASGKSRTAIASGAAAETDPVVYAWSDNNGNGYWWSNADKVYLPADCSGMFKNSTLTSLDLLNFDTSNVTNMSEMFSGCKNLISLDLSSFNTCNVTDMSYMFYYCTKLSTLDLSSFDTSNVTNMGYMFMKCQNLNSLNIYSFDTGNVEKMYGMFDGCSKLSSLDLSNFDTSNVINMRCMFNGCSKLSSLDVSSFNVSKVTDMVQMFNECNNLVSLDLSNFDTRNVSDMTNMFCRCYNLNSLDICNFETSNVTAMSYMFQFCYALTSLDLSGFNTNKVTSMGNMFNQCVSLTTIYVSDFITDKVTSGSNMFGGCKKLVGQNGTTYNSSYTNNTYARIDTPETPGYFTYKAKTAA